MGWTPNKVTLLRVAAGFAAVACFGHGTWANFAAVALTAGSIALDALDGHLARKKQMATPLGAQIDILGDRMIENMFFTYFAVVGMVSLWLPVFFFARGAATDFLRARGNLEHAGRCVAALGERRKGSLEDAFAHRGFVAAFLAAFWQRCRSHHRLLADAGTV